MIAAPLVVPGIVYAVAVYSVFGYLNLIGTRTALAHTVIAIPFVVILVTTVSGKPQPRNRRLSIKRRKAGETWRRLG